MIPTIAEHHVLILAHLEKHNADVGDDRPVPYAQTSIGIFESLKAYVGIAQTYRDLLMLTALGWVRCRQCHVQPSPTRTSAHRCLLNCYQLTEQGAEVVAFYKKLYQRDIETALASHKAG